MLKSHAITRRVLLIGAGAAVTAGALGASSTTSHGDEQPETPAPAPFDFKGWLDGQTPANRANYHQTQLAIALCEVNPGNWRTEVTQKNDFVLIVRDEPTTPGSASVFVQYLY
ncbi:MAG: hypothetical protein JWQ22_2544 [Devosia sp.]|nr:hypothetical protein [Devosia sp.]